MRAADGSMVGTGGTATSPAPRLVEPGRRPPRRCVRRLPVARCEPSGTVPSRELVTRPLAVRADIGAPDPAATEPTAAERGGVAMAPPPTGAADAAIPQTSQ